MLEADPLETIPHDGAALARRLEELWHRGERPDVHAFLAEAGAAAAVTLAAVLGVDQRQRWQAGERLPAEDYLRRYPALTQDPGQALGLVYGEFVLREVRGEGPTLEEYRARFPSLAERLGRQLELRRGLAPGITDTDLGGTATPPAAKLPATVAPENGARTILVSASGPAPAVAAPAAGSRYRPLHLHARGGLGEVHLAEDAELGRRVALKRMRAEYAGVDHCRRRFLREAEITARLEHPGVVPVHGLVYDADGQPNYVMRFLSGESLKAALDRYHAGADSGPEGAGRRLEFRRLLGAFVAVCQTVGYAHSKGVIHRDLKPANVMLGEFGETLVVDWGLAKRLDRPDEPAAGAEAPAAAGDGAETEQGQALGTPVYMSPEQAAGRWDVVGPASDVYGLGATLACLLTGRPPVTGKSTAEVLARVQRGELERPRQVRKDVPAALEAVCLKAMARRPQDRYASAAEVAAEVERFLADEPVAAYREPWGVRARRWLRRHKLAVAAAAVALLGVLASLAVGLGVLGVKNGELQQANTELTEANTATETARREAERRFGQTRAAVDEFFTEVSENPRLLIKERGTQALRRALLEKAKVYYEAFLAERGTDAVLRAETARAYGRLGQITAELNPGLAAVPQFRRALELYRQLAEDHPGVPEYPYRLSKTLTQLGNLYREGGRRPEALQALEEARGLARQLVHDHPAVSDYAAGLAATDINLGNVHFDDGRWEQARPIYEEARDHFRRLLEDKPGVPEFARGLGRTLDNLGMQYRAHGQGEEARRAHEEACTVLRRLVKDKPGVPLYGQALASALTNLGNVYGDGARWDPARQVYEEACALGRQLVRDHPGVPAYADRLGDTLDELGILHNKAGRREEARKAFEESRAVYRQLVHEHAGVPLFAEGLGLTLNNLGMLDRAVGRGGDARQCFEEARDLFVRLVRDHPEDPAYSRWLAMTWQNLGIVHGEAARWNEARRAGDQALALQHRLAHDHPEVPDFAHAEASTLANLGNLLLDQGKPAEALGQFDLALPIFQRLVRNYAGKVEFKGDLRDTQKSRARTLDQLGRYAEAVADWDRVLALDPGAEKSAFRLQRASALARAGRGAEAVAEADALTKGEQVPGGTLYDAARVYARAAATVKPPSAEAHAEKAVVLLRRARQAGYFKDAKSAAQLKQDENLRPLHNRADYRQLLVELEKR